ncbi:MAG: 3-isopropylmalate dehydrogenase [Chloroflexota bacterium]|nr:3-isopropylmalate dehydrogenase [Chloroflexota bacterium]
MVKISVLPGDGIGAEVTGEARRVLETIGELSGHRFEFQYEPIGGNCIDEHGVAMLPESLPRIKRTAAVLFGAVGGPKWDDPTAPTRPEDGLLAIRKGLGLYANLRPVRVYGPLADASPLKTPELTSVDIIVVRELTGGLYFGKPKRVWDTARGRRAVDTNLYTEQEIERVLRVGYELARKRKKKLASVDKANVLATGRLWRQVATRMAAEYADVATEHVLVDTCAMRLVTRPQDFDVIVTENTFGDILTDEAAVIGGSMGMLPSASLGKGRLGLYEPIHGTAPDIAGKGLANPLAAILSSALLLRYSLSLDEEARLVEHAVERVIEDGLRTADIASGGPSVGTREMADAVIAAIRAESPQRRRRRSRPREEELVGSSNQSSSGPALRVAAAR